MTQGQSPNSQPMHRTKPAHTRTVGAGRKRFIKMSLSVFAAGALIAAAAVLAIDRGTTPAPVAENGVSGGDHNSVGTIVLHSAKDCQQKLFDNCTGQVSDQTSLCPSEVVLDAKGMPIPTGTVHTLKSVSKSFK